MSQRGQIDELMNFLMFFFHVELSKTDDEHEKYTVMVSRVIRKVFK